MHSIHLFVHRLPQMYSQVTGCSQATFFFISVLFINQGESIQTFQLSCQNVAMETYPVMNQSSIWMEHKKRENKWTFVCMCVCLLGTRPWSCGATVQKHQSRGTYQPHTELPQSMFQSYKLYKCSQIQIVIQTVVNLDDLNDQNFFLLVCSCV